jgi:hypothetical protein
VKIWGRLRASAALLLLCGALTLPGRGAAPERVAAAPRCTVQAVEASGGRHANACALALGLISGGIVGMAINPFGGATAIAIGAHIALVACY